MLGKAKQSLFKNQQGLVSIVVAVILMLIMSLIVISMSQNTQREQRQTLDRQLSDQAFYNAESGINDVTSYLYGPDGATAPSRKISCLTPPLGAYSNTIGNDPSNKYTCILYDRAPKTLQKDNVSLSSPEIIPINPVRDDGTTGVNLHSLTLSWDDAQERDKTIEAPCEFNSNDPQVLPPDCNTKGYGGLRAELISPAGDRVTTQKQTLVSFLMPSNTNGADIILSDVSLVYPNNQGLFSPTKCNGPAGQRRCSKTITDIGRQNMFLALRSIYRPVNLTISGKADDGSDIRFKDAQIVIDSTGKASDVLRRVQVRIPATSQYTYPGFALQSKDSICKVLNVTKGDDNVGRVSSADSSSCPTNN